MYGLIGVVVVGLVAWMVLWFLIPRPLASWMVHARRAPGKLKARRARIGDQQWHWLDSGPGGDPLVVLHGFGADADHWTLVAPLLVRRFRILAPDLPGWGDSGPPANDDWSMDAQARRLAGWLDEQGIDQCWLGGNSMGGYVAVAFARLFPARVRGLWLLAPGGVRSVAYSELFEEIEAGRHNPLIVRNRSDFRRLLDFCFFRRPWIPYPLFRYLSGRNMGRLDMAHPAFDGMRDNSPPLEEMARGMEIPTLVVWGEHDRVLNPEGGPLLHSVMERSRLEMLPGCGHLPMLEKPGETARLFLDFVDQSEQQGRQAGRP